jgi:hypothetical protein
LSQISMALLQHDNTARTAATIEPVRAGSRTENDCNIATAPS